MTTLFDQTIAHLGVFRGMLWGIYLAAAVILPLYHVRPILRYVRGSNGIGDACVRTEAIQCLWRVPALLYSVFVAPSLPLFLSIFLDLLGRIGRVLAMHASRRRCQAGQALPRPPTHEGKRFFGVGNGRADPAQKNKGRSYSVRSRGALR